MDLKWFCHSHDAVRVVTVISQNIFPRVSRQIFLRKCHLKVMKKQQVTDNDSQHWLHYQSTLLVLILVSDLKAFNPRLSRNDLILGLRHCPVNSERRNFTIRVRLIRSRKHLTHTTNNFHVLPASNAQIWPKHKQRNPCGA